MIFDDVLPFRNLFVGLACTSVYWAYFPTFPSIQLNSFAFIGGCGMNLLSIQIVSFHGSMFQYLNIFISLSFHAASFVILHFNWYYFFQDHSFYFQAHEVLAFFQIFVWLIPFAFFISVSVNDTALPTHAGANSPQLSVGGRSFGLKAVFAFFRNLATPDTQGVLPSSNASSSFGGDDSSSASAANSDFSSPAPYIPSAAASQYGSAASAFQQGSVGADVASAAGAPYHTQQDGGVASRYGASAHSAPAPVPLASAPQPFQRPAPQPFASSASGLLRPMMHRGPVAPAGKSD